MKRYNFLILIVIFALGCSGGTEVAGTGGSSGGGGDGDNNDGLPNVSVSFNGVSGGSDLTADGFLTDGDKATIDWQENSEVDFYILTIFESNGTTVKCAEVRVPASPSKYSFSDFALDEGSSYVAEVQATDADNNLLSSAGQYSFTVDSNAPTDPTDVILYSSFTSNRHSSLSVSPDLYFTASTDAETSVMSYNVKLETDPGGIEVFQENKTSVSDIAYRLEGLSLNDSTQYRMAIQAVDEAGNTSNWVNAATVFTTSEISGSPYSGLADVSTLGNDTLSGNLDASTFTRTAPKEGNTLTISADSQWDPLGPAAMFLRANLLDFTSSVTLHSDGQDASTVAGNNGDDGGNGGSGGGGGGSYGGTIGGAGGSAGGNGSAGSSSVGSGGSGGNGSASAYAGFDYGDGGNGADGNNDDNGSSTPGLGGLGGSGAGGGGGGAGYETCCGDGMSAGGGGGGLIALEANSISGTARLSANGGDGTEHHRLGRGGGGGGGVIWTVFESYSGNLDAVATGGAGALGADDGEARLFQKMSDGSLVQRRFIDSFTSNSLVELATLPFATNELSNPSTLSDLNLSSPPDQDGQVYTRMNPRSAKKLDLAGTLTWDSSGPATLFFYVDELVFDVTGVLDASGEDGGNPSGYTGGGGGKGGSGGGGAPSYNGRYGGDGGSEGRHGRHGVHEGGGYGANPPGEGSRDFIANFDFGNGGNGGNGAHVNSGNGGTGGNGVGGGGGGGNSSTCCTAGYGGAGGGGLVAIVANKISGNGTINANGGNADITSSRGAGGGGGGVVWIATKDYDGQLNGRVNVTGGIGANAGSDGTAQIFRLLDDGRLCAKTFADTWTASSPDPAIDPDCN